MKIIIKSIACANETLPLRSFSIIIPSRHVQSRLLKHYNVNFAELNKNKHCKITSRYVNVTTCFYPRLCPPPRALFLILTQQCMFHHLFLLFFYFKWHSSFDLLIVLKRPYDSECSCPIMLAIHNCKSLSKWCRVTIIHASCFLPIFYFLTQIITASCFLLSLSLCW